jgi:Flp pilus assembly protein TadG
VRGGQRGVALVEFAITVIPLLITVFGITEFGRAIYQYDTLAKAARDAARYLSTQAPGDANAIARAQCRAVYGNVNCTGQALAPGLTLAMVNVCDAVSCPGSHQSQGATPVINMVTVTIGGANQPYTFTLVAPYVLDVASFDFGPISATMRQVL